MEKSKRLWLAPLMVLSLFAFQQFAAGTGRFVASLFSYDAIDPYGLFAWVSVHHIVQMTIALVAIGVLAIVKGIDFGFRLGDVKTGLEHTLNFTIVLLIYVAVNNIQGYLRFGAFAFMPSFILNTTNVAGTLGFQLLLSGTSEEILFRALPITLLVYSLGTGKSITIDKRIAGVSSFEVSRETIIAAALFAIAHIGWELNPFTITHLSIHQQVLSIVFGIFYGVAYQQSKSVIYPMIMHGISNFVIVGASYILWILFRPWPW